MAKTKRASFDYIEKLLSLKNRFRKARHGRVRSNGVELEGAFDDASGVRVDTSVEVCGHGFESFHECDGCCRDYCECASNCDCEECQRCENCDRRPVRCDCDTCVMCVQCEQQEDDCTCNEGNPDRRHSCYELGNTYQDCDLDGECYCECECECTCGYDGSEGVDGEKVSPVLELYRTIEWIHENYPNAVNGTCGGHGHKGGYSLFEYALLMLPEFNEHLTRCLRRWGKAMKINEGSSFWRRLQSGVSLIAKKHQPYMQVDLDHKDSARYCQLNYCWALHETLELRLLPMFQNEELYIKLTLAVDGIIEAYLSGMREQHTDEWFILRT